MELLLKPQAPGPVFNAGQVGEHEVELLLNGNVVRERVVTRYHVCWPGNSSADDRWLRPEGLAHYQEKVSVEYDAAAPRCCPARRIRPDAAAPAPAPAVPGPRPALSPLVASAGFKFSSQPRPRSKAPSRDRPGAPKPAGPGAVLLADRRVARLSQTCKCRPAPTAPSADRAQRRPPLVPESGTTGGRSWALLRLLIPGLLQVDAASCAQAPARQSRFSRQTVTAFRARQAGEHDWEEKEVFQWPGGNTQCHWHCGSTPGPVTVAPAIMSLQ